MFVKENQSWTWSCGSHTGVKGKNLQRPNVDQYDQLVTAIYPVVTGSGQLGKGQREQPQAPVVELKSLMCWRRDQLPAFLQFHSHSEAGHFFLRASTRIPLL